MKKFVLVLFVLALFSVSAFAIEVAQGTATVDGIVTPGEWTPEHFVSPLYRSAVTTHDTLGFAYAKYDCDTNTLYFYITKKYPEWPILVEDGEEVYIKWAKTKLLSSDNEGNTGFPKFEWVNSDGTYADGWEGAWQPSPMPDDSTFMPVKIHNNVDDGASQTAGINDLSLTLTCISGGALDVEFYGVDAQVEERMVFIKWNAVEASNHAGYNVWRQTGNNTFIRLNENLIASAFPGTLVENTYEYVDELMTSGEYVYKIESISTNGESSFSESVVVLYGISAVENTELPIEFSLQQNYPNPFNPSTIIQFSIPNNTFVQLSVFDITGKQVKNLWNQFTQQGQYAVVWNGLDNQSEKVAAGIYFYQLKTESFTSMKRMALIK